MKNKIKKVLGGVILSLIALNSSLSLTSCEDLMTIDTGDKTYVNAQDTLYSYLGIMRCMQNIAERQVILGEIRGDLVSSTGYTTDTLFAISNFENPQDGTCSMLQVSDYYAVINNCNFYIHNCDTAAIKSNVKYMVPEYAQVKAIRAWAYLQLVKNYGSVPYITEPISNLNIIKNFDYANNQVTKDNIIDLMLKDGILQFIDTQYPSYGNPSNAYGSWNNGFTDISARMCFIPIRLVLADMYLLRGESEEDYKQAAQYYYEFLLKEDTPLYKQYCTVTQNRASGKLSYRNMQGWGNWGQTYSYSAASNEVISVIPSSANAGLGTMLTRVADIFGYTPSSSQSANETTDSEGNATGEFDASGSITVNRNYKRQYAPSEAFTNVCSEQTYVNYTGATTSTPTVSYIENCDGRFYAVEDHTYEGESYPLCGKASRGYSFYYAIPIYRKSLIWLRLAEAINRAGYPEYAFAILKEGLNQYSLPQIVDRTPEMYDENGYLILWKASTEQFIYHDIENNVNYVEDEEGNLIEGPANTLGCTVVRDVIENDSIAYGIAGQCYWIKDIKKVESFNSMLDFSLSTWNSTYGIHAKGVGLGTTWTSSNEGEITTNISGTRDSVYYDYSKLLLKQGVDIESATENDIINAIENIIVDELALETAFEGNRFTDLVRIAEHKNASGYKGTEWLARKIALRNATYADIQAGAADPDPYIYNKLTNKSNWYLQLPAWSTK